MCATSIYAFMLVAGKIEHTLQHRPYTFGKRDRCSNHIVRYRFFVGFQPPGGSSLDEVLHREWLLENVASPLHFVQIIAHRPNAQSSTLDSGSGPASSSGSNSGSGSGSGLDHNSDASSDDSRVTCEFFSHLIPSIIQIFKHSEHFILQDLSELMADLIGLLGRSYIMASHNWETFKFRLFGVHEIIFAPLQM